MIKMLPSFIQITHTINKYQAYKPSIEFIKKELSSVRRTRSLHRRARKRYPFPIVALVGYTNSGKSTLFNYLTGADVKAEDQLFATLDPTMRRVELPSGGAIILSAVLLQFYTLLNKRKKSVSH